MERQQKIYRRTGHGCVSLSISWVVVDERNGYFSWGGKDIGFVVSMINEHGL